MKLCQDNFKIINCFKSRIGLKLTIISHLKYLYLKRYKQ